MLPSFESARRVPSDMPVVPFQLTSDATDEGIPDANVSVAIDLYVGLNGLLHHICWLHKVAMGYYIAEIPAVIA